MLFDYVLGLNIEPQKSQCIILPYGSDVIRCYSWSLVVFKVLRGCVKARSVLFWLCCS